MTKPFSRLTGGLDDLAGRGLYRSRRTIESPQGIDLWIDGKSVLNFCSNDYLGLANHPDVAAAFKRGADRYGVGSGSAHLICGHSSAHHALEEELADFTGRERALMFSTGYMANLGVISALTGRNDTVWEDRLNHASLIDGGLLSRASCQRYPHADVDRLSQGLTGASGQCLIVTDGVFSMDGDLAPLPALAPLAAAQDAWLMVDDAHGLGVIGRHGGGIVEHFALAPHEVPVLVGTLGKAFGTFGAFVAGDNTLIETLIQKARTYIYTTALPSAIAEATRASLRIIRQESWRREKLQSLGQRFQNGAEQLGIAVPRLTSAIVPVLIGDSRRATAISQSLMANGIWVSAIRPPTVPKGTARLRITFSALHEEHHIDRLLDALSRCLASTCRSSAPTPRD